MRRRFGLVFRVYVDIIVAGAGVLVGVVVVNQSHIWCRNAH